MKYFKSLTRHALSILLCGVFFIGCTQGWNVEAGQTWVKEYNVDNPYEPIERDTIHIIDVIGKHVQFTRNGELRSCDKFWIPVNGRLLK